MVLVDTFPATAGADTVICVNTLGSVLSMLNSLAQQYKANSPKPKGNRLDSLFKTSGYDTSEQTEVGQPR